MLIKKGLDETASHFENNDLLQLSFFQGGPWTAGVLVGGSSQNAAG